MNHRQEIVRLRESKRWTERQIARHLDIPAATVHYWLAKAVAPPSEPPKRGRPRTSTVDLDTRFYRESRDRPFDTAVDIRDRLAPHISVATVRKRLREQGLRCRIPARKPFLKPDHIRKRYEFAIRYSRWNLQHWQTVVFSDEKVFRASSKGPLHVYRPKESNRFDRQYIAPSTNITGRFTICVWVAFGRGFRDIRRVNRRTMNAVYYTNEILPSILDPFRERDLVYMQDRSPIHTSKLATHWFQMHNIAVMEDWPPKGPDMNPVENVWAELVRRLPKTHANREELWENVHAEFHNLEEAYLNNLIASMMKRMQLVWASAGGWSKY